MYGKIIKYYEYQLQYLYSLCFTFYSKNYCKMTYNMINVLHIRIISKNNVLCIKSFSFLWYFTFFNGLRNHTCVSEFHLVIKTNQDTKTNPFWKWWNCCMLGHNQYIYGREKSNEREIKISEEKDFKFLRLYSLWFSNHPL